MNHELKDYGLVAGEEVVDQLRQMGHRLAGRRVVHVNSTRVGGGVAEILHKLVPLMSELGIDTSWEVVEGDPEFYEVTKSFHNGLQGKPLELTEDMRRTYERVSRQNAEKLGETLRGADVVFLHDPQTAVLGGLIGKPSGKLIWRCHIDLSRPHQPFWDYLGPMLENYEASIFSLADFAQRLPHPQYLIPPSIDPLAEKNRDLSPSEMEELCAQMGLDRKRPLMVQVSRFDRFKDPVGVIESFRLARNYVADLGLVLAGGSATDDPEGAEVLAQVREAAGGDPDILILELPPDAHTKINALQRAADVVVQKSTREGFGLTVTEGLWKGKPVVGGNTGGIRLQVVDKHTGFLVNTPEGAALRVRYLMENHELRLTMGRKAREFVRENFLITRHLREYLTVITALLYNFGDRVEL
ncbi:MAG: glycosyltransferase [Deltaproteobacteria bacterium]|nr:glycosyltransferase [Deltaproteobacteria bacterium]